ncbi:MAG: acyltransferase [Pseudomonadota bacterium]
MISYTHPEFQKPVDNNRLNTIDLLRFAAAVLVVFYHYAFRGYAADGMSVMPYPLLAPIAKYGYLGVDLFFLISGFVVLRSASSGSLQKFVVSRVARLYPAFWVCCTLTFLSILAFGGQRYSATIPQYVINMTMLSGFAGVVSIDGVYWSLFVEIKFYLMIALLLLFRQMHRAPLFFVAWLVVTIALDLFPSWRLRSIFITDHAPAFIAGAMFYKGWSSGFSRATILTILAAWLVGLHHALAQLPRLEQHYGAPFNLYVVAGVITVFHVLIYLVATKRTGVIGKKDWAAIGALTYPLYLLHQNIGYMIFNIAYPSMNEHVVLWGTMFLMLALAYLVNVLVEQRYANSLKNFLSQALDVWSARINRRLAARGNLPRS